MYPTRNGLIISPYELGYAVPTLEQLNTRKVVNIHHGYFNRMRYHDERYKSVFRNLISNVYPLLFNDHQCLHEDYDQPKPPKPQAMIDVVEEYLSIHGIVECIREKQTRQTYVIQPEEWFNIRDGYKRRIK